MCNYPFWPDFCCLFITFANSLDPDQDQQSLFITFANSLDPDQDQQNVGPDLDPNCLTL